MNKILVALVVILIGIQSWTLKTQQQILNEVMPEVKLDTTIGSEYCSYLKKRGLLYLELAKSNNRLALKFSQDISLNDEYKEQLERETINIGDANKFANTYQAFCKD
jgi:hypothetical protein